MTSLWWVIFIYLCLQVIVQIIATLSSDDAAKRSGYFIGAFMNGLILYFMYMIRNLV